MEEFKNLKEIIELCRIELYTGDKNIHATLGFEELKELQCLLDNYDVHKRSNAILLAQKRELEEQNENLINKYKELFEKVNYLEEIRANQTYENEELEKMVELMAKEMSFEDNSTIIDYFKKKVRGD